MNKKLEAWKKSLQAKVYVLNDENGEIIEYPSLKALIDEWAKESEDGKSRFWREGRDIMERCPHWWSNDVSVYLEYESEEEAELELYDLYAIYMDEDPDSKSFRFKLEDIREDQQEWLEEHAND